MQSLLISATMHTRAMNNEYSLRDLHRQTLSGSTSYGLRTSFQLE